MSRELSLALALVLLMVLLGVGIHGWWRRRKLLQPAIDGAAGPELRVALRAAQAGDSEPLSCLFAERREGGWNERMLLVQLVAEAPGQGDQLARWCEEEPDEALAWLLHGTRLLLAATPADAPAGAEEIQNPLLEAADEALRRAANLDPADPTPHAVQIARLCLLAADEKQAREHFQAACQRCPGHLGAHLELARYLGPEGPEGSAEALFRFARDAVSRVRAGHLLNGLLVFAHVTCWHHLRRGDARTARDYIDDPTNQLEVFASFQRFRAGDGRDKHLLKERSAAVVCNYWAFFFYLTRDRPRLRMVAPTLLTHPLERPWNLLGEPRRALAAALHWVYRA